VAILGTIRQDGSPRMSAIASMSAHDEMLLGMLWRSRKALDLVRDPQCVVRHVITGLDGTDGETKPYGQAVESQGAGASI
jgi:hypothetical protein